MKQKIKYIYSAAILAFLFSSCSKEQEFIQVSDEYRLEPTTDVARKIIEHTDLMAHLHYDTAYQIVDGLEATEISYISSTGLVKKIFTFEVDLSNPSIHIKTATPNNSPRFAMQRMTEQAKHVDTEEHKVWGGINADFYDMSNGTPQGIVYKEGLAIKTTFRDDVNTFFSILDNEKAFIGTQSDYGNVREQIQEAIGGRVILLSNGALPNQTDYVLEPRTAIGVSEDGDKVYILVVDGRRFHYSNGMNYEELGKCLQAMGAYQAINLDGGGSSTFFIRNSSGFENNRFELRNWPSDNGGQERSVANGLLIISTANQ